MIKVAVIDREALYIDMVMQVIEGQPDIRAIAGTSIYEDFIDPARDADIALVQNETSVATTREIIRTLRHDVPQVAIVVISVPDVASIIIDYIAAGAVGYVRDINDAEHMLNVIRIVANGESLAHPELVRPLFVWLAELNDRLHVLDDGRSISVVELTPRQIEVADLLAAGKTNQEIAGALFISPGTVKNHVHRILEALQATDRQRAAAIYRQFRDDLAPSTRTHAGAGANRHTGQA
jgi:DNA-binding NarL/FixJ family response regulator